MLIWSRGYWIKKWRWWAVVWQEGLCFRVDTEVHVDGKENHETGWDHQEWMQIEKWAKDKSGALPRPGRGRETSKRDEGERKKPRKECYSRRWERGPHAGRRDQLCQMSQMNQIKRTLNTDPGWPLQQRCLQSGGAKCLLESFLGRMREEKLKIGSTDVRLPPWSLYLNLLERFTCY